MVFSGPVSGFLFFIGLASLALFIRNCCGDGGHRDF
jgi:hypothetical protein